MRTLIVGSALMALGCVALVTGVLPLSSAADVAERVGPILLFVAMITVVTELAAEAGLFQRIAELSAVWGRGRTVLLWLFVVAFATLSTIFLSLDTTAVLLTPVVVVLARHVGISPLPFALTTVWLANTASLFLPVSNLSNLLAQHQLDLRPLGFVELLWAPAVAGIVVPMLFLWLLFRKDLHGFYQAPTVPPVADKRLLVLSAITVSLLLPALVSGIAVAIPASIAAIFLLIVFMTRRPSVLRWSMVPVQPLLLTVGLFMMVAAFHDHGLSQVLGPVAGTGNGFLSLLQLAGAGALSANGVNNLPAYLALEPLADTPVRLAALLIGVNLGPLISPWASLATLLWHSRLKAMGVNISWRSYALAGLCLVLVLLPTAVLALWLSAGLPS